MATARTRPVSSRPSPALAIAIAAATLNSAVVTGGEFGAGTGSTAGDAAGGGRGSDEGPRGPLVSFGFGAGLVGRFPVVPVPCFRFLTHPLFVLGLAAVSVAVVAVLYRRAGLLGPIGFVAGFGPPVAVFTSCVSDAAGASPSAGTSGT